MIDDLSIRRIPRRAPIPDDIIPPIFKLPAFWRGAAVVRREHEPGTAALYERVATALEAGQVAEDIPEFKAWLASRTTMGPPR